MVTRNPIWPPSDSTCYMYLINDTVKRDMQYIIFYIFWVKDSNFANKDVIAALYIDKTVK